MTQEERELLIKDLCARLPYRVKVKCERYSFPVTILYAGDVNEVKFKETGGIEHIDVIKPYLRPMSSMTEDEKKEYESFIFTQHHEWDGHGISTKYVETDDVERYTTWLNKNMFDYRGLIEKGLALEAKEGMYGKI